MTLLGKIFNAIHDDESAEISSIDEKLNPSINNLILIEDSEDGNNKKSILIGNLPTGGGDYSGFGEVFVNLFSGSETTDENNWKSLGASEIDTAKFGFDGYFEAVLSSSDDAGAAELRLFNLTTNEQIGDILEVNGEISFVSEQITLTGGVNIYEAQLRSPDGYYAVCKNARVSFYKFILNAPDASEDGYVAIAQSGGLVYIGGETDGYVLTWNAGLNSWEPQEPTGSGGGGTLAETLALGNTTGSNDIIVSIGGVIIGGGTIVASTPGDVVTPGALTLGIAAGSGFDDGSLTLDGDGGLVQITAGEGYGLGDGGSVDISAGSANGADSDGGDIYLTSGLGIGTGRGGNVQCYVMPSDGSGDGGEFQVYIGGGDPEDLSFKVDAQGDGYFYNNLEIDGKLTVGGLIDPTGLVLDEQATVPGGVPNVGKATIWIRSSDGYAVLTNSDGETTSLSGGEGSITAPTLLENGYVTIASNGDLIYVSGETDGYVLTWNASLETWEPQAPTGTAETPTLSEVLTENNSAGSQNITDLLDPINLQDAATKNYIDGYVEILGGDLSGSLPNPEVTDFSITSEEQGSILYFNGANWSQLSPGADGYVLTTHDTGSNPTWEEASGTSSITPPTIGENGYVPIANNRDLSYISGTTDGYVLTWNSGTSTWGSEITRDNSAIHDNIAGEISTITEKTTPTATDLLIIEDSADSNNKKRIQISSIFSIPGLSGMMNDAFVATEDQTAFTLSQTPSNDVAIMVVDGITQSSLDFTVSGTSVTYSGLALSAGQAVDFWYSLGTGGGGAEETWISPDPLDADVNDWNPTGFSTATIVRVDAVDDGYSITGFDASATAVKKEIINVSAYDVVIANQDVGSVATNRIISQTGGLVLAANDSMTIVYDLATERWRVI